MTLRYVKGYLLQFTAMFTVCFGVFAGVLLAFQIIVPFLLWDFSIFYNELWISYSFFMLRTILIISVVVSIWYCTGVETKRSIREYVEKGNEK
jgi:hypothetical protein